MILDKESFKAGVLSVPAGDIAAGQTVTVTFKTKPEARDPYMDDDLAAFPYVTGSLFADGDIIIPRQDENIADLPTQIIMRKA